MAQSTPCSRGIQERVSAVGLYQDSVKLNALWCLSPHVNAQTSSTFQSWLARTQQVMRTHTCPVRNGVSMSQRSSVGLAYPRAPVHAWMRQGALFIPDNQKRIILTLTLVHDKSQGQ